MGVSVSHSELRAELVRWMRQNSETEIPGTEKTLRMQCGVRARYASAAAASVADSAAVSGSQ